MNQPPAPNSNPGTYYADMEAIARSQPTFPKFFGFNTSAAVWNRRELDRQYKRMIDAMEELAVKPMSILLGSIAVGVGVFLFVGLYVVFIAGSGKNDPLAISDGFGWILVGIVTLPGIFLGTLIGYGASSRHKFKYVYARAFVIQKCPETGAPLRAGLTWLKRLGFINRSGQRYFFGTGKNAGVKRGLLLLVTETPLSELTVPQLYDLVPGSGTWRGNAATDTFAAVEEEERGAELMRKTKKTRLGETLLDGGIIVVTIVAMVFIFLQAQSGFDLNLMELDYMNALESVK